MNRIAEEIESYYGCGSETDKEVLEHYGMPRRSGRYPWGSGDEPYQHSKVIQGAKTESVPLGELKKLAEERMLLFDEDLMTFTMGNCITLEDTNGNRKLLKNRYDHKIDAVAAMMDAYVAFKINREGLLMLLTGFTVESEQIIYICGLIAALWGLWKIVKELKKPNDDLKAAVSKHTKLLDNDNKRLKEYEESNRMILQCLLVIINHEITGNGIENLKHARDDLQEYLINK